jgi:hypothetical protein
MDTNFELTPPPAGPTSAGQRLVSWHELEGKTIRCVMEAQGDTANRVIVTEDDCWAVLEVNGDEHSGFDIEVEGEYGWHAKQQITEYLSPQDLFEARLVNQGQMEWLLEQKKRAIESKREARAAALRAEAEAVDSGREDWRL